MPVGFSQLYWGVVQYRLEFVVGREERGESVTHKGCSWEAESSSRWPEALSSEACRGMGMALPWGLRSGGPGPGFRGRFSHPSFPRAPVLTSSWVSRSEEGPRGPARCAPGEQT